MSSAASICECMDFQFLFLGVHYHVLLGAGHLMDIYPVPVLEVSMLRVGQSHLLMSHRW